MRISGGRLQLQLQRRRGGRHCKAGGCRRPFPHGAGAGSARNTPKAAPARPPPDPHPSIRATPLRVTRLAAESRPAGRAAPAGPARRAPRQCPVRRTGAHPASRRLGVAHRALGLLGELLRRDRQLPLQPRNARLAPAGPDLKPILDTAWIV